MTLLKTVGHPDDEQDVAQINERVRGIQDAAAGVETPATGSKYLYFSCFVL